jgi:hypothetical protein
VVINVHCNECLHTYQFITLLHDKCEYVAGAYISPVMLKNIPAEADKKHLLTSVVDVIGESL